MNDAENNAQDLRDWKAHGYLSKKESTLFGIPSVAISIMLGAGFILYILNSDGNKSIVDIRSIIVVCGGVFCTILFQFNIANIYHAVVSFARSLLGNINHTLTECKDQLDEAIVEDKPLSELAAGEKLNGELINDCIHMISKGLEREEIHQLLLHRMSTDIGKRKKTIELFQTAGSTAPAFGLFGTVIGLIGLLTSLNDPAKIGPSMALALLTTAYGTFLATAIFNPIAGRLASDLEDYISSYESIERKIQVLMLKEERRIYGDHVGKIEVA